MFERDIELTQLQNGSASDRFQLVKRPINVKSVAGAPVLEWSVRQMLLPRSPLFEKEGESALHHDKLKRIGHIVLDQHSTIVNTLPAF